MGTMDVDDRGAAEAPRFSLVSDRVPTPERFRCLVVGLSELGPVTEDAPSDALEFSSAELFALADAQRSFELVCVVTDAPMERVLAAEERLASLFEDSALPANLRVLPVATVPDACSARQAVLSMILYQKGMRLNDCVAVSCSAYDREMAFSCGRLLALRDAGPEVCAAADATFGPRRLDGLVRALRAASEVARG